MSLSIAKAMCRNFHQEKSKNGHLQYWLQDWDCIRYSRLLHCFAVNFSKARAIKIVFMRVAVLKTSYKK